MADMTSVRSELQKALLTLYRRSNQSRLMRSPLGQRAFEAAYLAYKILLEAGPIGQLRRFVAPGSCAIDVGANIGLFTLNFARWVGDGGGVIAIEPETRNFHSLQRRITASRYAARVSAIQAAAAETPGTLNLDVNPDHPGDHKLGTEGTPTTAVTLDGLLAERGNPPVSMIKIDVQGAEMRVLQGASILLQRSHPTLFVEVDDNALRKQGSTAQEVVSFLTALGYRAYRLRRFRPIQAIADSDLAQEGYEDILFLSEKMPVPVKAL
jgi:FkbM family methyltransferase